MKTRVRSSEAVSMALVLATLGYDAWVAGTLYVPVPEAQEVLSLACLLVKRVAKITIWARISLLSLRDPDV
jgi:hypothetical protein